MSVLIPSHSYRHTLFTHGVDNLHSAFLLATSRIHLGKARFDAPMDLHSAAPEMLLDGLGDVGSPPTTLWFISAPLDQMKLFGKGVLGWTQCYPLWTISW